MKNIIHTITSYIVLFVFVLQLYATVSFATDLEDEPVQLPEPQGACSYDSCSPATPCPSPDEMCYSSNGVFYCCVEPPFPGAEAVGN